MEGCGGSRAQALQTGNKAGAGGAVTIVNSRRQINFVLHTTYLPDRPDDVNVFWGYGQVSDVKGDFIKGRNDQAGLNWRLLPELR